MITPCRQQSISIPDMVFRSITVLHDLEKGEDSHLFIYSFLPPTKVFNIKEHHHACPTCFFKLPLD